MIEQRAEKRLKGLGLNSYEVKMWTALLSRGVSTAGELSDIANVPRSRSYDVLESLQKKGFVTSKLGTPIKYIACSPSQAVETVKNKTAKEASEEIRKLSNIKKDVLDNLNSLHGQGIGLVDISEISGTLRGRNNLYNHLEFMLKNAQKSITLSTTQKEFGTILGQFRPLFEKAKKKNIKIKIFTQIDEKIKGQIEKIKNIAKVAHTSTKSRFCIIDGKEIIFMILDENEVHPSYDTGIWVNAPLAVDLEKLANP